MGLLDRLLRRRSAAAVPVGTGQAGAPSEPSEPSGSADPGWRWLPLLRRTVGEQDLLTDPDGFRDRLSTWQDPTFRTAPGHLVNPQAPAGLGYGLLRPATPVSGGRTAVGPLVQRLPLAAPSPLPSESRSEPEPSPELLPGSGDDSAGRIERAGPAVHPHPARAASASPAATTATAVNARRSVRPPGRRLTVARVVQPARRLPAAPAPSSRATLAGPGQVAPAPPPAESGVQRPTVTNEPQLGFTADTLPADVRPTGGHEPALTPRSPVDPGSPAGAAPRRGSRIGLGEPLPMVPPTARRSGGQPGARSLPEATSSGPRPAEPVVQRIAVPGAEGVALAGPGRQQEPGPGDAPDRDHGRVLVSQARQSGASASGAVTGAAAATGVSSGGVPNPAVPRDPMVSRGGEPSAVQRAVNGSVAAPGPGRPVVPMPGAGSAGLVGSAERSMGMSGVSPSPATAVPDGTAAPDGMERLPVTDRVVHGPGGQEHAAGRAAGSAGRREHGTDRPVQRTGVPGQPGRVSGAEVAVVRAAPAGPLWQQESGSGGVADPGQVASSGPRRAEPVVQRIAVPGAEGVARPGPGRQQESGSGGVADPGPVSKAGPSGALASGASTGVAVVSGVLSGGANPTVLRDPMVPQGGEPPVVQRAVDGAGALPGLGRPIAMPATPVTAAADGVGQLPVADRAVHGPGGQEHAAGRAAGSAGGREHGTDRPVQRTGVPGQPERVSGAGSALQQTPTPGLGAGTLTATPPDTRVPIPAARILVQRRADVPLGALSGPWGLPSAGERSLAGVSRANGTSPSGPALASPPAAHMVQTLAARPMRPVVAADKITGVGGTGGVRTGRRVARPESAQPVQRTAAPARPVSAGLPPYGTPLPTVRHVAPTGGGSQVSSGGNRPGAAAPTTASAPVPRFSGSTPRTTAAAPMRGAPAPVQRRSAITALPASSPSRPSTPSSVSSAGSEARPEQGAAGIDIDELINRFDRRHLDHLAHRLVEPLGRLLRAEVRLGRERTGRLLDGGR
ncbi:hypothetical protein [Frankia sp. CiP3]|uniref:hypothetical protein n=1 Tax=Frankia sp. CiP3 TaxID=2880971 RepID=UPI001EF400D4|nr:hypothetical protein [Frankia sp. CiP3]